MTQLVVPEGHLVEPVSVQRLGRQLAASGDAVTAIVAPVVALVSGASSRTAAERASLRPRAGSLEAANGQAGAALVRDGVGFEVDGDVVRVEHGTIVVDHGAVTHAARGSLLPIEDADATGRSPFPRRPMVLLLGLGADPGRAIWARDMVHALLDEQIEARLAVADPPAGPHLTRPSRPSEATVVALQPDVVVTLDESALDVAASWCDRRSTALVHHTGERTTTDELLSWRIGGSYGRVRALIGSAVDAETLAALCSRLCSTPFPEPPPREPEPGTVSIRVTPPARSVAVIAPDDVIGSRLGAFLSESVALGASSRAVDPEDWRATIDDDVVLVADALDASTTREIIAARLAAGRRTVVDVTGDGVPDVAIAAGAATAPSRAAVAELAAAGVVARLLPPLVDRAHLDELRRARADDDEDDRALVLGVDVSTADRAVAATVAHAVVQTLDQRDDLEVEVVGSPVVRSRLDDHERRCSVDGRSPGTVARWHVQIWAADGPTLRPAPLVDAAYLGVPSVFPSWCRGDIDDDLVCSFAVAETASPEAWIERIAGALDRDRPDPRLASRAELLFGPRAGASLVNRILGWAGWRGM